MRGRRAVGILLFGVISLAGAGASAQGFEVLGKGVQIDDAVARDRFELTGKEPEDRTHTVYISLNMRLIGGLLIMYRGEERQCLVNGVPTDKGMIFARRGAHAGSYSCDAKTEGTASASSEVRESYTYKTRNSIVGNTVTLDGEAALGATALLQNVREGRMQLTTRASNKFHLKVRIANGRCQLLEFRDETDAKSEGMHPAGHRLRSRDYRLRSVGPATHCSIIRE